LFGISFQKQVRQTPAGNQPPPPPPTAGTNATLDSDGSSATYIVTEQLVGINFPNDAEGLMSVDDKINLELVYRLKRG
jgi:hypothetical protein